MIKITILHCTVLYECMYACMNLRMYANKYVSTYVPMYIHVCVPVYVSTAEGNIRARWRGLGDNYVKQKRKLTKRKSGGCY